MSARKRLTLRRDEGAGVRLGRPWVFRDALELPPGLASGDVVDLYDARASYVASGMVEPESPLTFRAWCLEAHEPIDAGLVRARVAAAAAWRSAAVGADVTALRVCHGEGDHVPGLQCDVYASEDGRHRIAVLRTDGRIGVAWEGPFIEAIVAAHAPTGVVVKNPHVDDGAARVVRGTVPGEVAIRERERRFWVNIREGQKTGFFLDQRDNRSLVGRLSRGLRVLNLFSYTGGFSVAAALGGAQRVVSVDIAGPAIEVARRNFTLNGVDPSGHGFEAADAFDVLAEVATRRGDYDLIVLDPPSFAPSAKSLPRALKAYEKLNAMALSALAPGSWLASASCSSHVRESALLDLIARAAATAGRRVVVAGVHGAGPDHPNRLGWPEGHYLKFVLLRVLS